MVRRLVFPVSPKRKRSGLISAANTVSPFTSPNPFDRKGNAMTDDTTDKTLHSDLRRRAQAIIDDTSGQYTTEAQLAVAVLLANPNASDDDLRARVGQVEAGEFQSAPPYKREPYGRNDIAPIYSRDTVDRLEPYAGQEGIAEIERLTKLATSDEDQEVRGLAFLELLAHVYEHDGSGWIMYASEAALKNNSELMRRAYNLLIADAQRERRAANTDHLLSENQLDYTFEKLVEVSHSGSPAFFVVLALHVIASIESNSLDVLRTQMHAMIDYFHNQYRKAGGGYTRRDEWVIEQTDTFNEAIDLDRGKGGDA